MSEVHLYRHKASLVEPFQKSSKSIPGTQLKITTKPQMAFHNIKCFILYLNELLEGSHTRTLFA